MIPDDVEILKPGDDSGNGMLVRFRLPSGLAVYGLPTKNFYGGHWDLGPTWNYVIMTDPPFLVDTGRRGQGRVLEAMMAVVGLKPADLGFVLISHGHEDHDGGLGELAGQSGLKIRAHRIYDRLIRCYPGLGPNGNKQRFPAKCWHCFMPESFSRVQCLDYHRELVGLKIDPIGDGQTELADGLTTCHLPGHSPDSLAVCIGHEAVVVGDIILPDISPWPTQEALFDGLAAVIGPEYTRAGDIFGLQRYLKSIFKLVRHCPGMQVFPAHRLFNKGRWNGIELAPRAAELRRHHVQRCAAVLDILADGPKGVAEITRAHFAPELLKGFGHLMAEKEVDSHCELLLASGDVRLLDDRRYAANGSQRFETRIGALTAPAAGDPSG